MDEPFVSSNQLHPQATVHPAVSPNGALGATDHRKEMLPRAADTLQEERGDTLAQKQAK